MMDAPPPLRLHAGARAAVLAAGLTLALAPGASAARHAAAGTGATAGKASHAVSAHAASDPKGRRPR